MVREHAWVHFIKILTWAQRSIVCIVLVVQNITDRYSRTVSAWIDSSMNIYFKFMVCRSSAYCPWAPHIWITDCIAMTYWHTCCMYSVCPGWHLEHAVHWQLTGWSWMLGMHCRAHLSNHVVHVQWLCLMSRWRLEWGTLGWWVELTGTDLKVYDTL